MVRSLSGRVFFSLRSTETISNVSADEQAGFVKTRFTFNGVNVYVLQQHVTGESENASGEDAQDDHKIKGTLTL